MSLSLFATRLKTLRRQAGESQEQAAACMGVTRSAYSTYERDINVPPYIKLKKIADHYGVSVEYLMGQTNNKQPKGAEIVDDSIIDVYDEMVRISDFLGDETSAVLCKGRLMDENSKEDVLHFINSFIKFIDYFNKYIPEKEK